jgi:hypothetical protein
MSRSWAAALILAQSALSGRDDRAGGPVAACGGAAERADADTLLAAVAKLPMRAAAIAVAVAVSIRLRAGSGIRTF